ncbi:MAG: hypothetical protein J0I12_24325 [Candidatus Eremiobacteraeota bacterium]|nr:hypothetical protein [Candidatus Eremiobacteraeota bacterium]
MWATTFVLGGAVLIFGGLLVYWNSDQMSSLVVQESTALSPADNLSLARQHFLRGDSRRALTDARVALALELQKPSEPPLERDIRRVIGQADLEQKHYVEAVEHFSWLQRHGGNADDLKGLDEARARLRKLNVDALNELEGAQQLSTNGVQEKALAQARRAVGNLQQNHGGAAQVQSGHLVMASISLRQGNYQAALTQLREARKLGPLTGPQQAALDKLEASSGGAVASARVPVVVPRLESQPSYPQGRPGQKPIRGASPAPAKPAPVEVEDGPPESAAMTPPPRRAPRLELPKLQYPGGQNAGSSGIPGYQRNNNSSSLPGYNTGPSRTKDSLPGY